ncbi:MAG: Hydrolase, alpha/beta fold family protein, At1g52510/AT4G12830 homolog, group3 [uncultured Sphingomonadaceae bacterium]|uniref:Hydrolase, alpha/beta fold family protein, At1g52510/AT4G12830 homolog, group3 n=1 Tax=uncultured Sphingomonadaceae bacterium TaxID=169976 RepID=A0A6J4SLL3_9SPHN|nr:MAG: Hydrolase, alpha/beta fold family protein, At1g52510/AT4G12830 homolog, group3 [uncultured Sphingomonadaceae bacterium]
MRRFSRRESLAGLSLGLAGAMARPAHAAILLSPSRSRATPPTNKEPTMSVTYNSQKVGPVDLFYREAGPADAPVILLLHGFPTTSHMFRDLIPQLASRYRVIAPDLPGFGLTKAPPRGQFDYTFENLAKTIEGFTEALGLKRYALYVFDYGAPVGYRLAAAHPERVTAIVSQNGNAYAEGLSKAWSPYQAYWENPSTETRNATRAALTPAAIRSQYETGADKTRVSPDGYTLDIAYFAREGTDEIQLDLIYDYRTNVALYDAWQAYFRTHKPPLLAAWGSKDIFFLPPGAEAFRRDIPDAEIRFFDTGHFALETHGAEIGSAMLDFLDRRVRV